MDSWHSYPSIFHMGHKALKGLLDAPVIVQEKIDGSQFSFGIDGDGGIYLRSKGAAMYIQAPEKMFLRAVETVMAIKNMLHPGWTYRAEYLQKPRHNALAYDRVPKNHLILFDINNGHEQYLAPKQVQAEAERLGLETVPTIFEGLVATLETIRGFLDLPSILGGQKIEGVVIKPADYGLFGLDKKVIMGKFVSESFKETHARVWSENNPAGKDIVQRIGQAYQTQARWMKAIQHLRETGQLEDSPHDIGLLIREAPEDVRKEHEAEIKDALFAWAWPSIRRIITAGLPEWYKEELLKRQFDATP